MKKSGGFLKGISLFEISLLISFSFFVAFAMSESVSAQWDLGAGKQTGPTGLTTPSQVASTQNLARTSAYGVRLNNVPAGTFVDQTGAITSGAKVVQIQTLENGNHVAVLSNGDELTFANGGYEQFTANLPSDAVLQNQYSYDAPLFGTVTGGFAHLLEGVVWSVAVVGAIQLIGSFAGLDEGLTDSLSLAAVGGIMTYKGILSLAPKGFNVLGTKTPGLQTGTFATVAAIGVAVAIFVLTYKEEKKENILFECLPWEAPVGGERCEECNNDPLRPCSEYRCRSLGQACEIVNPGTEEEQCVWVNKNDAISPTINAWDSALKPNNLEYRPSNTVRGNDRGVKIYGEGANGCLQAFTPLEFGIILDEPGRCKIDTSRNNSFEDMQFYFGESNLLRYNHTQRMRLPASDNLLESPLLENDGDFNLFVNCQDANGNVNVDSFVFSFCVDPSPDTTPPIIEGSSVESGGFVSFNADSVPIELYINEPSECKWSRQDKNYEDMENLMSCTTQSYQVNADLQYTCSGNLTGIANLADNDFYFRCKDQPAKSDKERFVNVQSYELTLKGSQKLNILEIGPNETIVGSTQTVPVTLEVRTDDGAEEGKAICYFSRSGNEGSFVRMFETNDFVSRQILDLDAGDYEYYVRCVDAGGNSAEANTGFTVFVDKNAPRVTRVYNTLDSLKITTDEDAECAYSTQSCNFVFEEGLPMIQDNIERQREHFAKWENNAKYYVKCRDDRGNEPSPNACSIIASAINLDSEL